MTISDVVIFFGVFVSCYVVLAGSTRLIHLLTKNHTHDYHIAVIIFALLVAAMVTYTQLGR